MMNIDLNLLSPNRKNRINRLVKFLFAKNLLEFLIIAIAIIAIILLWGWIILIDEFNVLAQSSIEIGRDYTSYNAEVRRVNRTIRSIDEASFGYLPITPKLLEIISSTPANIKINSIDINRPTKSIIISGTALNRNALLNYQETLNKITWMESAVMPTTQLLQKENINFEYQTKLKGWPVTRPTETTKK